MLDLPFYGNGRLYFKESCIPSIKSLSDRHV